MIRGWFISGTDTGVGKTLVACGLLSALRQRDLRVVAMKPVASGCRQTDEGLRCDDADRLLAQCSTSPAYTDLNPYAFVPAIAPHIAAQQAGVRIDLAEITGRAEALGGSADYLVVEGVGGWQVPLTESATTADLAEQLGLPVILVVAMRLGCLNHALLTVAAIARTGLPLAGWVANCLDPDIDCLAENIAALKDRIPTPLLAVLPHGLQGGAGVTQCASQLAIDGLLARDQDKTKRPSRV